ncbi:uncharacterized protein N7458_003712 [Penicillium daleae]|uniref:DUF3533 domain-containing protein n=1 Tax=Penicillium daleae TaxID=63821 RepID=A0AAD6G4J5_9EURO|nr:uncharacterized protein N7458_003712 [Penicillium daleae]KAJ5456129.1 hypothetical protein N7458_003712 [Penicillium daleae]
MSALPVWVVDFDGQVELYRSTNPLVGPLVTNITEDIIGSSPVYDERAYVAIIINSNATALLYAALSKGNTSYNPKGAVSVVTLSTRDQVSFSSYITPAIYQFESAVLSKFGSAWVKVVANENFTQLATVPQAVNPGIGFTSLDLRPFRPAIIWRIVSNIVAYFFLSLFYSFVSLAYYVPLSNPSAPGTVPATNANKYGARSFVVYWMLNWVGISALGFLYENIAMVITNVGTGFYALNLAPMIETVVEASRTILFDTHSRIGLDFAILFVWIAVSLAFFPVANFIMRWRIMRFGK